MFLQRRRPVVALTETVLIVTNLKKKKSLMRTGPPLFESDFIFRSVTFILNVMAYWNNSSVDLPEIQKQKTVKY